MEMYCVGQRWSYRARGVDVGSTLLIGAVEQEEGRPSVIHITIAGIVTPRSDAPIVIGHMPFSKEAIDDSVLELLESGIDVPDGFEDGFAVWKAQEGGVFALGVAEAIEAVIGAVPPPPVEDGFDAVVNQMRATRSRELIGDLYRRLFLLKEWFFLCEPQDARVPVQWRFPEGMNPNPALLAFTSRQRAASAAVALGLYPQGGDIAVMPASVPEAIDWISGPGCSNEWLCFNLTQVDFPLYVSDAVSIFESM